MSAPANGFTLPLIIELRPSRRCAAFAIMVHAGALLGVLAAAGLPPAATGALLVLVGLNALRAARDWRRRMKMQPRQTLLLDSSDAWWLCDSAARRQPLRLLPGPFVHPQLVVLRFRSRDFSLRTVVLCPDNAEQSTLRRLRVRLRFAGRVASMLAHTPSRDA